MSRGSTHFKNLPPQNPLLLPKKIFLKNITLKSLTYLFTTGARTTALVRFPGEIPYEYLHAEEVCRRFVAVAICLHVICCRHRIHYTTNSPLVVMVGPLEERERMSRIRRKEGRELLVSDGESDGESSTRKIDRIPLWNWGFVGGEVGLFFWAKCLQQINCRPRQRRWGWYLME